MSINDTANSLGLHDTLKYGPRSLAAEVKSEGTLKDRLENVSILLFQCSIGSPYYQWEATQDNLKLTLERNLFGMHAPMRRLMERKIVANVRCIGFALLSFSLTIIRHICTALLKLISTLTF